VSGSYVTFEPAARSAWHSHPLGQTLIVTAGTGWVQQEGGAKQELRPGDVVWTPPGVKHWARRYRSERHDTYRHPGVARRPDVEWMEKVSDAQYAK